MKKKQEPEDADLINAEIEYLIRLVYRDLKNYKNKDSEELDKNIKNELIRRNVLNKLCNLAFKTKNYGDYDD